MSSLTRLLAFSLFLLLVLVVAGLAAQSWIKQQEQRIVQSSRIELESQLAAAIALTGGTRAPWDDNRLQSITAVTSAELQLLTGDFDLTALENFHGVVKLGPDQWLVASHPAPIGDQILNLFQRVIVALGVFAVVLAVALVFSFGVRPLRDRVTRSPFLARDHDMRSLSTLARTSVRQQAELSQERDDRVRAEEEARQRLQLLNQALEEKIRIGRDLHDGVIQSLYAAGLTLESTKQATDPIPEKVSVQINSTLDLINRTIRDIRSYINGLSPMKVRSASFAQALGEIVTELRAGRPTDVEMQIDEPTAAGLSDIQTTETIQIVREAVSNALRHGGAQHLVIRLGSVDSEIQLLIRDDGTGFEPTKIASTGLGLANIKARVEQSNGLLNLVSAPGHGTTIRISWPTPLS